MMVKEQLLNILPEDVQLWVYERKPKTSAEAGELAENYMQARKYSKQGSKSPGKCPRCGTYGHWASYCSNPNTKRDGPGPTGDQIKLHQEHEVLHLQSDKSHNLKLSVKGSILRHWTRAGTTRAD